MRCRIRPCPRRKENLKPWKWDCAFRAAALFGQHSYRYYWFRGRHFPEGYALWEYVLCLLGKGHQNVGWKCYRYEGDLRRAARAHPNCIALCQPEENREIIAIRGAKWKFHCVAVKKGTAEDTVRIKDLQYLNVTHVFVPTNK